MFDISCKQCNASFECHDGDVSNLKKHIENDHGTVPQRLEIITSLSFLSSEEETQLVLHLQLRIQGFKETGIIDSGDSKLFAIKERENCSELEEIQEMLMKDLSDDESNENKDNVVGGFDDQNKTITHDLKTEEETDDEGVGMNNEEIKKHPAKKIKMEINTKEEGDAEDQSNTSPDKFEGNASEFCKVEVLDEEDPLSERSVDDGINLFCRICYESFSSLSDRVPHEIEYHNNQEDQNFLKSDISQLRLDDFKNSCSLCGLRFVTTNGMDVHKMIKHRMGMNTISKCKICKQDVDSAKIKKHIISHGEGPSKCKLCYKVFSSQYGLNCHQVQVHSDDREFINIEITNSHLKFLCDKCDHRFVSQKLKDYHMKNQHDKECKLCYKYIADSRYMNRHLEFNHKNEKEFHKIDIDESQLKFECTQCIRKFVTQSILSQHMKSHEIDEFAYLKTECYIKEGKNYKCKFCYAVYNRFNGKGQLRSHILMMHKSDKSLFNVKFTPEECKYCCKKCNAKIVSRDALQCHDQKMHGKIYVQLSGNECKLCYKILRRANKMNRHMNFAHKDDVEFIGKDIVESMLKHKCKTCDKRFVSTSILKKHYKMHREEKYADLKTTCFLKKKRTYQCKLCYIFKDRFENLLNHVLNWHKTEEHIFKVKIELDDCQYVCEKCNSRFITNNSLACHTKLAHERTIMKMVRIKKNIKMVKSMHNSCKLCLRDFKTPKEASNHKWGLHRKHPEELKLILATEQGEDISHLFNIQCKECDMKFFNNHILVNHMSRIHSTQPSSNLSTKCDLCLVVFLTNADLRKHIHNVHEKYPDEIRALKSSKREKNTDDFRLNCKFCSFAFINLHVLNYHVTNIHKEDIKTLEWICDFCNQSIKRDKKGSIDIKKHMEKVHGITADSSAKRRQSLESDTIRNFQIMMQLLNEGRR